MTVYFLSYCVKAADLSRSITTDHAFRLTVIAAITEASLTILATRNNVDISLDGVRLLSDVHRGDGNDGQHY
jgi:hypothetical protein